MAATVRLGLAVPIVIWATGAMAVGSSIAQISPARCLVEEGEHKRP